NKEHTVVLAADTVAECRGEILGKPRDEDHARQMLTALSGREHRVFTGVRIVELEVSRPAAPVTEAVVTTLTMDPLTEEWLEEFLASEKWRGKAGAFGLQDGIGVVRVTEGSETNVVGLPMELVVPRLAERGCRPDAPC
ncbi:MAG: Maf family protein, partial [Planctomycetota bacterium]